MHKLSENYYLRKCYLERDEVPTQSMMRKKMSPALSEIYFKSMNQKLKRIAGLEPPLKGGGNDWYIPPEELLNGRTVLAPVKKSLLTHLNHHGIDIIGQKLYKLHQKSLEIEKEKTLTENDEKWRRIVTDVYKQEWEKISKQESYKNMMELLNEFDSFALLYRQSFDRMESLFHEVVIADINKTKANAQREMQNKYKVYLKHQAISLTNEYDKKLLDEKARLKAEFIQNVEICRTKMGNQIHDLNVEKQIATEKLSNYLKRLNLACQVYVALKERDESLKERTETEYRHRKLLRTMSATTALQNFAIYLQKQRENKIQERISSWMEKLLDMLKTFQLFVSFCLTTAPENAEFFINLEKLMLLQINETLENPFNESIFEVEEETFHTPVPQPQPFYLFCDKGYKANIDHDLCPKNLGRASDALLPAVIVNKRCIYAACDNFDQFTHRIKDYIYSNRGDDAVFQDDLVYENFVPVTYTSSHKLLELKLESSIMQILQQEIYDLQKLYVTKSEELCKFCKTPSCKCTLRDTVSPVSKTTKQDTQIVHPVQGKSTESLNKKNTSKVKESRLSHEREPKWESFLKYMEPKKCACIKKKYMVNPLPSYMTKMKYGPPLIPDYEICPLATLKELVKKAKKEVPRHVKRPAAPRNKDANTQYVDEEYKNLCRLCEGFAENKDDRNKKTIEPEIWADVSHFESVQGLPSQENCLFAHARAQSLRNLLQEFSDLQFLQTSIIPSL